MALGLPAATGAVVVANKCDLPSSPPGILPQNFPAAEISALTGSGLESLQATIAKLADTFQAVCGDELIAINARHAHALEEATQCLDSAYHKLSAGDATELVASDLRGALDDFGQIAGKIYNEQVLDRLFSAFCIGK